jgi:hypothetical protein
MKQILCDLVSFLEALWPHSLLIFFLTGIGGGTQGLVLARQALCHLSHVPQHFFALVIFDIESYFVAVHDPLFTHPM